MARHSFTNKGIIVYLLFSKLTMNCVSSFPNDSSSDASLMRSALFLAPSAHAKERESRRERERERGRERGAERERVRERERERERQRRKRKSKEEKERERGRKSQRVGQEKSLFCVACTVPINVL
jgi:hypothetical protein